MKSRLAFVIAIVVITMTACQKEEPELSGKLTLEITDELTIGRTLFYDKQLSVNNTVSCASCHKQMFAFADNVALSSGYNNQKTIRNSPPIQNLSPFGSIAGIPVIVPTLLFWDGREDNLREMMLQPVVNHREMGITDLDELCKKLEKIDYYTELFLRDYGTTQITPENVAIELANFVAGINSEAKIDKPFLLFTPQEEIGKQLFLEKYDCGACHQVQNRFGYNQVSSTSFANIGLDVNYSDKGLANITSLEEDKGRFKIPSLRNVSLTAPYMHDGRFSNLEDVLDHYSHGMASHRNLDSRLRNQNGAASRFNITDSEKKAIIAFLHTMTDYNMISDPLLSDPFKVE